MATVRYIVGDVAEAVDFYVSKKTKEATFLASENLERPSGRLPISTCSGDTFPALPWDPVLSLVRPETIRTV